MGLAGCAFVPADKPAALPTLKDIRPPPARVGDGQSLADEAPQPLAIVRVSQLDIRADAKMKPVWALVDDTALPAEIVDLWRANGLRVGLLDAPNTPAFRAALPQAHRQQVQMLIETPHPLALSVTPPLGKRFHLTVTLATEQHQQITLRRGRCQFLLRFVRIANGACAIDLIPHHYVHRPTVRPRTPHERALDGRVFSELTLRVFLPDKKRLVIGIDRSGPNVPREPLSEDIRVPLNEEQSPSTQASQADGREEQPPSSPPLLLPNELGSLLLGASRAGKPVQILLIIDLNH